MALSNINVGTVANDGTGDTIRAAFQKINTNNGLFATVALTGAYSDLTGKPTLTPATHPGYISGNWYSPFPTPSGSGAAVVAGTARFLPFIPPASVSISTLGIRPTTPGSSNVQLAIYASDASTKRPTGTQLAATANIANNTTSPISAAASASLTGGSLYWLAMNCNDSSMIAVAPSAAQESVMGWAIGSATIGNVLATSALAGLATTLTFGTWGDLTAATWTESTDNKHALVFFKVT
jgi:hypothetical protein